MTVEFTRTTRCSVVKALIVWVGKKVDVYVVRTLAACPDVCRGCISLARHYRAMLVCYIRLVRWDANYASLRYMLLALVLVSDNDALPLVCLPPTDLHMDRAESWPVVYVICL